LQFYTIQLKIKFPFDFVNENWKKYQEINSQKLYALRIEFSNENAILAKNKNYK